MARTLKRAVLVADTRTKDKDGNDVVVPVQLNAGDEVPGWVDEDEIDDEWYEDPRDQVQSAGTDMFLDQSWNSLCAAADKVGVEYKKSWSKDQIAQAIRHYLFAEEMHDAGVEDYEYTDDNMVELNDQLNAAGNVNAPDLTEKETSRSRSRTPASTTSGSSGGSDT